MDTVVRAAAGDVAAFTELVRRHEAAARGYAWALLGDAHLAEDACQEAFLEAFAALPRLRDPAAFAPWLRGIVRHRCLRLLRRSDLGFAPLPPDPPSAGGVAWEAAARTEEAAAARAAVRALPPALRDVAALHYLKECSHAETAVFLGLNETTVNNRLFKARQILKRRIPAMAPEPPEFAARIGRILAIDGPVVEARFDPDATPDLFDALAPAGDEARLRVVQRLPGGVVRCVTAAPGGELRPGAAVANTTAVRGTFVAPVPADDVLAAAIASLGHAAAEEPPAMAETGIKPIDLFCPIPVRGNVGILGTSGTGKMVVTPELARRLGTRSDDVRLFYLAARSEPALVRDLMTADDEWPEDREGAVRTAWLLTERASDPVFASSRGPFDAAIYCSPLLGVRGLWPAVDPFHSASRVRISDEHAALADRARDLLERTHPRDPQFLEYLACRAYRAARDRLAALADADPLAARARRLEQFLTTPFLVAEDFTRTHGRIVPLEETLAGVRAILDGEADDIPEEKLRFIGPLSEAR